MECWLYEILIAQEAEPKWQKFFEGYKKYIRFDAIGFEGLRFHIDGVMLQVDGERTIKRIVNIKAGAA